MQAGFNDYLLAAVIRVQHTAVKTLPVTSSSVHVIEVGEVGEVWDVGGPLQGKSEKEAIN